MSAENDRSDQPAGDTTPARGARLAADARRYLEDAQRRYLAASRNTRIGIAAGGAVAVLALLVIGGSGGEGSVGTTFEVRRGAFDVIVREGGNIEALQSQQIRSAIRGNQGVKILAIVDEGYRVTPEDVANGKVLVELDSSSLDEQKLNQEIAFETAEAQFIERKAQLDIRINQNVADLNAANQKMKFALLDFERFLGANVVQDLVARLEINERLARSQEQSEQAEQADMMSTRLQQIAESRQSRRGRGNGSAVPDSSAAAGEIPAQFRQRMQQMLAENGGELPAEFAARMPARDAAIVEGDAILAPDDDVDELTVQPLEPAAEQPTATASMLMDDDYLSVRETIDFSVYADEANLEDGEAKQQLRTLQEDVRVAEEGYLQAVARLEGQRRLAARDFITPNDLEVEESRLLQAQSKLEQAQTEMALYTQYTFPKDAEQQLANYENAIMSFQRTKAEGDSELAQAEARFKSAERRLNLEAEKLADINEQLAQTVIRAQRPGLVVYGSAEQNGQPFRGGGNQEPIAEGATVRERQPILTIPDMTEMAVRVNIHESAVQRVREGQKVAIRIDAFPNTSLAGEVIKVAVVADSGNAFMNPDMKVYPTMVKIDGIHDWLRPGMSAEVEILVESLQDAVYVPLQAVTYLDDRQVVYVADGGEPVAREVEVGSFSEQFIEIVAGVQAGEQVLLLAPPGASL